MIDQPKIMPITGKTFRLESLHRTLLGTIVVPDGIGLALTRFGRVHIECRQPPVGFDDRTQIQTGTLCTAPSGAPHAVVLYGLTPEEFEVIPGCAFYPGAAYLRTLQLR